MATTLPSAPHRRARLARAIDAAVLETWPIVDVSQIANLDDRRRFERLKSAVELYSSGATVQDVIRLAIVDVRWFYRLLEKCEEIAPDGRPWGFRALVRRSCDKTPVRVKARVDDPNKPSSGWSGSFRKLLADKPEIEVRLIGAIRRLGKDRLSPNTLKFRGVKRIFLRECHNAGFAFCA